MPCYFPISAYLLESGGVSLVERGRVLRSLFLPCDHCVGCYLERSRQWAVRMEKESKCYDQNCFITLTYDDSRVSAVELSYPDFQAFMRRLRKAIAPLKVRFFMCGEYGEKFGRPHFHVCLFGYDFPDKQLFSSRSGVKLYTSAMLSGLWSFGFCLIGSLTFESAAYCARYVTKKAIGKNYGPSAVLVDPSTGECRLRRPEFARMSLKPGIGEPWLRRFVTDVYPSGDIVSRGKLCKAPRYFDKLYKKWNKDSDVWEQLQHRRYERAAVVDPGESSDDRLAVREQVAQARLASFPRKG